MILKESIKCIDNMKEIIILNIKTEFYIFDCNNQNKL